MELPTRNISQVLLILLIAGCTAKSSGNAEDSDGTGASASNSNNTTDTTTETQTATDTTTDTSNNPPAPLSLTDGTTTVSLTGSPEISWSAVTGAASYEVALGTSAGGNDVLDWTDNGTSTSVSLTSLSLTANNTYFASVRVVDADGNRSTATSGDGWDVNACPSGYTLVPGNTTAGLGGTVYTQGTKSNYDWGGPSETIRDHEDFCVMKYEAKDGGSHTAVSTAGSLPWVSIARTAAGVDNDAKEACENNGAGYYIIGNQHWQAIAREIENVSSNFDTSGSADTHAYNRGHADSGPGNLLAASTDGNGCFGITSNGDPADNCGGVWHENKRTHTLTNASVIWDFAGNAREHLADDIPAIGGGPGLIQQATYPDVLAWGPENDYSAQSSIPNAGLGIGYFGVANGGLQRSGDFQDGNTSGIFFAAFNQETSFGVRLGFRCVYAP